MSRSRTRKFRMVVLSTVIALGGLMGLASPAHATCTEPLADVPTGCIERYVCAAGAALHWDCIA